MEETILITTNLDELLVEYEQEISQVGIQFIWLIGEKLKAAKEKIIEHTGDKRAPGFIDWAERKFGFKKTAVSKYILAYEKQISDIKKIWGNEKSVQSTEPNSDIYLYNIWNTHGGDDKEYFGHFPYVFMYNLLHYHTKPGDVIYDPFAGSGTTAEACAATGCDYYCSDLNPQKDFIRQWDVSAGLPADLPHIDLAFLDPPYWKQAKGKYSDSTNDLGNMKLEDFNGVFESFLGALAAKGIERIAVVIQPTQYSNDFIWTDHIFDFATMLPSYRIEMRYILPYSTQQYNAQMVIRAKQEKKCLGLNRDLVIWRKG